MPRLYALPFRHVHLQRSLSLRHVVIWPRPVHFRAFPSIPDGADRYAHGYARPIDVACPMATSSGRRPMGDRAAQPTPPPSRED